VGAFTAKYCTGLRRWMTMPGRRPPHHAHTGR
jgi:hypothetical protein